jgi:hypothetical protein
VPGNLPDEPFTDGGGTGKFKCVGFASVETGAHPNPLQAKIATLTVFDAKRRPLAKSVVQRGSGFTGLDCGALVRVALAQPALRARVTLVCFAAPATVRALRGDGTLASTATTHTHGQAEMLTLAGPHIAALEIVAPSDETWLTDLCVSAEVAGAAATAAEGAAVELVHTATAATGTSIDGRSLTCYRYRVQLGAPHQLVEVGAQVPAFLAIALREGKAVDSRHVANANGLQAAAFAWRGADEVLIYTGTRVSELTICVDPPQTPDDEEREWSSVPYLARGIQLPARAVNPALTSAGDESALANSRLIAGETLDPTAFADLADTRNTTASAGTASPMWFTTRVREKLTDPFIEMRPWPYALSLGVDATVRRALGFGYLDAGAGLTAGAHYDYRITGRFLRRDLQETLFAFHTIPSTTTLPATFHLDRVRVTTPAPTIVELYPPVPAAALRGTSRKGIAFSPKLALGFDLPVLRVVLELEPALMGTVGYSAKTSDFIPGLSGSVFTGTITSAQPVTLDFPEPIDTLELTGSGFLYGVRLPSPTPGDPTDVIDGTLVLLGAQYAATSPPAPPPALGTTNLQQPIVPVDPAVTAPQAPDALGFTLRWVPPALGAGATAPWPTDLGAVPPSDVAGFLLERRRVDTGGAFTTISTSTLPTVFFGNRGARSDPPQLYFGMDLLSVFPEVSQPVPPVDPWISVDDVLHSAANPAGPPPGSLHQYRVSSIDAIGRRSTATTVGSVVRLEKHIAPPAPTGPDGAPPAGTVRPAGVRARVLQASDPDLATDDRTLLGASTNAVVLEWGWTASERARDEYATEFRVYWQSLPPDLVSGTLHGPATLAGGVYEMSCTLDQAVAADEMKGRYFLAPTYPFKVAGHGAGTSITVQIESSVLHPEIVPSDAAISFSPAPTGADLRPAGWEERTAVVPITVSAPVPFVFRDRLTLNATHTRARVWVGVSSADAQSYIADELPATALNGGRPGNESSTAAVSVEARYLGRPTFVVPPPLPNVPEDVSPEPAGDTVAVTVDLPTHLPAVVIPAGHSVVVDRFSIGALVSALSRRSDGTIGVRFPDQTTASYTPANSADQTAMLAELATSEPARIENRFLMDALLRYPTQFEVLWQRALPVAVPFAAITDTLPSKADRWLYRVRLADQADHVSEGAAIVPRMIRVASTRTPGAPSVQMTNSTTDSLAVSARVRDAFDLKWLVLFTLAVPDPSPLDSRLRDSAKLLRIPNRRDLYPTDGLRLRLADGTLLSPAMAVDIHAAGTVSPPDVIVPATLTPGYGKRVSVWAVTMTRDGMPSRFTGPTTADTAPPPLVVPALTVTQASGTDTASWPLVTVAAEISLERSTDGGASWTRVSPWLPTTATTFVLRGSGPRRYRLVLRGTKGQPTATGSGVVPA